MSYNNSLFKKIIEHAFGSAIEHQRKYDELMKEYQILKDEIREGSEYIFTDRDLSRMTGLYEEDLGDLRDHLKPFIRSFNKISLEEAITLFFVYARLDIYL